MAGTFSQAEQELDGLLASRIIAVPTSSVGYPAVLVKLKVTDNLDSTSPLASIGLRLLVKAGHHLVHQTLICRQVRELVKDGLAHSRIDTPKIKEQLGLVGAYTDFGLALEVIPRFVDEIEGGNGHAAIGTGGGETQLQQEQYFLIITATNLNLSLTFFLDPVPAYDSLVVAERHFFAPLLATFAATLTPAQAQPPGRRPQPLASRDLEAAVDAFAQGARDAGGASAEIVVFGDARWSQAAARWAAVASGAVEEDNLPRIKPPMGPAPSAAGPAGEPVSSPPASSEIDDRSSSPPPPPAKPPKGSRILRPRDRPCTSAAARMLDHNRRDLPGERIGFDETQTQLVRRTSSPGKRPGMSSTGLSSQLEVTGLTGSGRKGKGKEKVPVIELGSSEDEDGKQLEEDEEPGTEPEPTPSPEPDEPDTDEEEDEAPPPSSLALLPNPPDTQSQHPHPRSPLSSPTKSASVAAKRGRALPQQSPTKPPWAVKHQPPPPTSPTKRKAAEVEAKGEAGKAQGPPPDKRKQMMLQRRKAQMSKKSG